MEKGQIVIICLLAVILIGVVALLINNYTNNLDKDKFEESIITKIQSSNLTSQQKQEITNIIQETLEEDNNSTQQEHIAPGPNCEYMDGKLQCEGNSAARSCISDSDGGKNYNVKGSLSVDCTSPCGAWIDSCQDSKTLVEYYCDGTNLNDNFEIHTCPNKCENGACV